MTEKIKARFYTDEYKQQPVKDTLGTIVNVIKANDHKYYVLAMCKV